MQDNYTDLSFNLGLRKLAGIRSIAPAIQVYDLVTWSDTIYLVQKDKLIYLFGCEMTPLEADCIKIEYVSTPNVLIKPYVSQTSFIVSNVSEVDSNGATDYYSTSISGSPVMKRTKLNNESSFNYYADIGSGVEQVVEEFDTAIGTSELILDNTYSPQNPTKINNYNFCRSFKFLVDGYYIITLDESKSALYNNIDTDYPISNPDSSTNYNQYKSTTRGPWSPTAYGTMKHGQFLKRRIIVHCVDSIDNPDLQTYEDSPINFNLNNQSLSDGNTNDDIVAGITLRTLTTVLKSPNLLISGASYDGTEPVYSSMGFCIDPTKANTEFTTSPTDTNIAVGHTFSVYNLRNRIFDSLIFSGSADFVKQEKLGGVTKTTDMRNSTFKNCKFTNITFGSPDGRQLLLDGSSFINCKFENCKFIISPRNMLIKNCTIDSRSNMNGFFECKGSDGNLFIDLKIKNCSHPFVFDNSNSQNNINNLVYNTSMYVSAGISNTCSFLKVVSDSTSGTFTGNLILKNTIQNSIGNPIVIESTASLNLFAFNNLESSGSIKLGKLADEKVLWAASWFPSTYLSSMITPMYRTDGRLSAGATLSETITTPSSAISSLSNIPEDRRVILVYHLGASFSDQYWLSQGTKLDSTYNIIDACKDSNGNYVVGDTLDPRETAKPTSYGGSQRFISPWYDNQSAVVKSSWSTWLNSFKTSGGTAKYFIGDIQEGGSPVGFFSDYIRQNSTDSGNRFNQTHFSHIINDPRSSNSSVGNSSIYGTLQHQLKLDSTNSTYTLSDFASLSATELALGSKGGYKLWDFVTGRLAAYYVNDSFYAPISSKFPLAKVSNYENITITENEEISNSNGHRAYYDNNIGNAVAPELYGEIAFAGTVYEIDPTNTTRLIYNPSPTTPFGINAWNSLLLTQQKLRSITRNKGQKDLHVWLAGVNVVNPGQNAFGGLSDPLHDAYWLENVYHTAMHNPDLILYFNHNSTVVDDQKMHDALTTINTKTFNGIQEELSTNSNKINFDTNILISGCYTRKDENLWRITFKSSSILFVSIGGVLYSREPGNQGFWFSTEKNINITVTSTAGNTIFIQKS